MGVPWWNRTVRVTLLPSSFSASAQQSDLYLSSYIINESIAIDAGALGLMSPIEAQAKVRHVLISHSHIDHIATLPIFVDNVYNADRDCVIVHGSQTVLECLQRDVFNGCVWPDFVNMTPGHGSFLKLSPLEPGVAVELDGLRITPVPIAHTVPTLGFVIEDRSAAIAMVSDTGPTNQIWDLANRTPNLKAVFLEASFPNSLADIAEISQHLTPALFAKEIDKIERPVRIVAVHLKPRFRELLEQELRELNRPNLDIVRPGVTYEF
jgi:ribonuclease BN (tRNA processing enzyme)